MTRLGTLQLAVRDTGIGIAEEEIPEVLSLAQAREEAEKRAIPRALSRVDGNITRAAKMLGVSRPTLYDLLRQHKIKTD